MPSPKRVSWAKFRVTAVSSVSLLILLTLFYLLTGNTLLSPKVPLYLYMPDGQGLEAEAPVRVDGVDVGQVKTVALSGSPDPNRAVRVTMEIERARLAQMPANSEAEINSDTLIGDKFVDITSHPAPAPLRPGGEILLKKPTDIMKAIDILDLERQLRQVDTVLQDLEAGRGDFGEFVHGHKMYDDVVKRFTEIDAAMRAGAAATTDVGNALYKDQLWVGFMKVVQGVDQTLARLQSGQGEDGRFLRDPAEYAQWRSMLGDFRKSVADIRGQPFVQSNELYASWNQNLDAIIQRVDRMDADPMFNTAELYESVLGEALELQKTVRDFREHPGKYLRITVF